MTNKAAAERSNEEMAFAKRLKAIRLSRGYSHLSMGEATSLDPRILKRTEKLETVPSERVLFKILNVFPELAVSDREKEILALVKEAENMEAAS